MTRAIVLVDGEHYPPVTMDAIRVLATRGLEIAGAVFLGGGEKLSGALDLGGIPLVVGASQVSSLRAALERFVPDVVWDLSDAPIVDSRSRAFLASVALAHGASYEAAGMRLDPPPRPRLCPVPSIAVIGTGKRCGKTAVGAFAARTLAAAGVRPVVVSMGRGGPPEPVVVRGDVETPSVPFLVGLSESGRHAASDCYEDAIAAGVATVGAWRAGAGPAGAIAAGSVEAAIRSAAALDPEALILEGSGTAIPPSHADATILVAGSTPPREIEGGLGPYRLLLADLLIVTMDPEPASGAAPVHSNETLSALASTIHELEREVPIVRTALRPRVLGSVTGKKAFVATTAPEEAGETLRAHMEERTGARIVAMTHRLADRAGLARDLEQAAGTYEVLVTELKAAAIDVAARAAIAAGAGVVFFDNEPVAEDLPAAVEAVWATARKRFANTP